MTILNMTIISFCGRRCVPFLFWCSKSREFQSQPKKKHQENFHSRRCFFLWKNCQIGDSSLFFQDLIMVEHFATFIGEVDREKKPQIWHNPAGSRGELLGSK